LLRIEKVYAKLRIAFENTAKVMQNLVKIKYIHKYLNTNVDIKG
jgi:hypothetical protein